MNDCVVFVCKFFELVWLGPGGTPNSESVYFYVLLQAITYQYLVISIGQMVITIIVIDPATR